MKLPRKRYLLPLLGLLIIIAFVAGGLFFASRIISIDSVKRDIETRVSRMAGAEISYTDADIVWTPWPVLIFHESRIEMPDLLSGTIDTLVVIPKLIPLLAGDVKIGKISAKAPSFCIRIPSTGPEHAGTPSFQDAAGFLAAAVSGIPQASSGKITVEITSGQLVIEKETQPPIAYNDIDATLLFSPSHVKIDIAGNSDREEKITLALNFDPEKRSGECRIELNRFLPQSVYPLLFPKSDLQFGGSRIDLRLDLVTENLESLSGTLATSSPLLTLNRGDETQEIKDGAFESSFFLGKDRIEVSLSDFNLGYPLINVNGNFLSDTSTSEHRWELTAIDFNLADTGKCFRFLIGHYPIVELLCSVLKDGWIRKAELRDEAPTLADLKKVDNLWIKGFLDNGTVFIPAAHLTLTEATGWVTVEKGVLEGNDLQAQLGDAKGHGSYRMQLTGEHTAFYLDTSVNTELQQLPVLLQQLVHNAVFQQEMAKVGELNGTAEGHLIIDHSFEKTSVKVDVSRFNLEGRYTRIPLPVSIGDGEFHYDDAGIRVENLRGSIGESLFSGVKASIATASPFRLELEAGATTASMAEVLPWLKGYSAIAPAIAPYGTITGLIHLKSGTLKGPALRPREWNFLMEGHLDNLNVATPLLPIPVTIRSGAFAADPAVLSFNHVTVETPETSIEIQGRQTGYLKKESQSDITLSGTLGPDAATWVQTKMSLPQALAWQSPLVLTPITVVTTQKDDISISGSLGRPDGPAVELELHRTPKRLSIRRLNFRDDHSDATFSILAENDGIDFGFTGSLNEKTLNALFSSTPFLSGHIEGNFNSKIILPTPLQSIVRGHLHVEKLDLSKFDLPLVIHQASLAGVDNGFRISNTRLTWQENDFLLDGRISRFKDGLDIDLTTAIERINWLKAAALLAGKSGDSKERPLSLLKKLPIYGNIKVHADQFIYNEKLSFNPLDASLSFSDKQIHIAVTQAKLCGLPLTGHITYGTDFFNITATPAPLEMDLPSSLSCVWGDNKIIDGQYRLSGQLGGKGTKDTPLIEALSGEMSFNSAQGRIYRFGLFAKIFTLLNVAGLLKGEVPELDKEGFPYKTARAAATFENGKLIIREGEIDSTAMRIFFSGEENFITKTHDLTIVVAPLSTVDLLVRNIPLVRSVLDKGVVIYPITVTGTWENPQLNLMAPTAVGEQIWGVVFRALKLPFDLVKPVFNGTKKETPEHQGAQHKKSN